MMNIVKPNALLALLAVACGPNAHDDGWVMGTYSQVTAEGDHSSGMWQYVFEDDGHGEYLVHSGCGGARSFSFTWKLEDKDLVRVSAREGVGDEREQLLARTGGCGERALFEFELQQLDNLGHPVSDPRIYYRSDPCLTEPSDPVCGPPGDEYIEPTCLRFWCDDNPPERCDK